MINYIVALYFGSRLSPYCNSLLSKDPLYFFRKHIEFLQTCSSSELDATFVVSGIYPEELREYSSRYNILSRENIGFSYGAWNDAIKLNVESGKYDYFFMIEDDYIPTTPDFYKPFVDRATLQTPLVCSKAGGSGDQAIHPQISNGIIRADVCKIIYNKYNNIFIYVGDDYNSAYYTQVNYINNLKDMGYNITDILDQYSSVFNISDINKNINFGNPELPTLLTPIKI